MLPQFKKYIFRSKSKQDENDTQINFDSIFNKTELRICKFNINLFSKIRAVTKLLIILLITLICIPFQSILTNCPGRSKVFIPPIFWTIISKILGLKVRTFGKKITYNPRKKQNRPILYICNHYSWLDIVTLGQVLPACFVAKKEVSRWPLIGTLCRIGQATFITRERKTLVQEQNELEIRLKQNDSMILFPEGTSTNGSHLYPFMTSFFVLAKPLNNQKVDYTIPILQPISIAYDGLNMLPANRYIQPIYCWYGDMELVPHIWDFCQNSSMHASIIFHKPLYPENFKSRKTLAKAAWEIISKGSLALRNNYSDKEIKKCI